MTATIPSTALVTVQPVFTDSERLALAGFLAGYRGLTREAYTLDLRQFTAWCRTRSLSLFSVRRADIETFARELETKGRARATVTRRLCTIAGFYKYAVEEELLEHSPAAHLLALDELRQDEVHGLLDLTRPSGIAHGAFRSGLDVHPATGVRVRSAGAVSLPGLAVDERTGDGRVAEG
jgi:site-specific recombinase XerD